MGPDTGLVFEILNLKNEASFIHHQSEPEFLQLILRCIHKEVACLLGLKSFLIAIGDHTYEQNLLKCEPRRGLMISKIISLEQLRLISELDLHWVSNNCRIVPHLSNT